MVTYINKQIKGYYLEVPQELDKKVFADRIGTTYKEFLEGKWVLLSEEQLKFKEEHPNASVDEVFHMRTSEPVEPTIEQVKAIKIHKLNVYDRGQEVNQFLINGEMPAWFTPEERANYKNSVEAAKLLKQETLSLFINDILLEIPTDKAEMILAMIQRYADECYIVTKQHELKIASLETTEEVEAYDFTTGYPEKLDFKV